MWDNMSVFVHFPQKEGLVSLVSSHDIFLGLVLTPCFLIKKNTPHGDETCFNKLALAKQ